MIRMKKPHLTLAGLFLLTLTFLSDVRSQPKSSDDVFKKADASKYRTLFSEDFEGPKPRGFVLWYRGQTLFTVKERSVTDKLAQSGKQSFKISIHPSDGGNPYFWLPVRFPRWSELTITMHVKTDGPGGCRAGAGWAAPTAGFGGNVIPGTKVKTLVNGWEKWRTRITPTLDPGDFLQGLAIFCELPKGRAVTFYIDDIIVEGRLPEDFSDRHERIKNQIDTERTGEKSRLFSRRLLDVEKRFDELRRRFAANPTPRSTDSFPSAQAAKLVERIAAEIKRLDPLVSRQVQSLREYGKFDERVIRRIERGLMPLEVYVDGAAAFNEYLPKFGSDPFVVYGLDPTQSARILPTGPQGHKEELSYYEWGGTGGLENPQILPNTSPVPAVPSRRLEGFGCPGQYIPLSFAVQAGQPMESLRFQVSPLENGKNILTADAIDLRVVKAWWRPFADKPRFMNELLLHDEQFVNASQDKPENSFKESKYPRDTEKLTPVSITAGQCRQFWVTVHLPDQAKPGRYRGVIQATSDNGQEFDLSLGIEVMPFDLEPTPFAYSFYYRSYLRDEKQKKEQGVHSWYKTRAQMKRELVNMGQHGINTLCTYTGDVSEMEAGWDFSGLKLVLDMAREAGLTRSPFVWLSHGLSFRPLPERKGYPHTSDEVVRRIKKKVSAVNRFLAENGYARAAWYGEDERHGEQLIQLRIGYQAVNDAGGLVATACSQSYFNNIGTTLSLPIVYNGAQDKIGLASVRASQAAGYEAWIYNCPATDQVASPSVYRRRYGLAMWRNGENGAIPWEYSGHGKDLRPYMEKPKGRIYAMTHPTWEGPPIDTIIYEAFREGIYDTRYLATLRKHLALAKRKGAGTELVEKVEKWLETFSVNDDLQQVRRQMAESILELSRALKIEP